MVLVTLTTAGLSYSYAKSEIMSAAGVFYALVATRAAEAGLTRLAAVAHPRLKLAALALVLAMSGAWAFRALGTPYHLQRAVFAARSEWVLRMPPFAPPPVPVDQMRLGPALRAEALARGGSSPFLLWPRYSWFWGD